MRILFTKKTYGMIIGLLISILIIGGCSSSNEEGNSSDTPNEPEFTLTYSDHDPPGAMRTTFLQEVWFPEIEKQTDNRVTIEAHFGGSLLSSQEVFEGIKNNAVDMGHIFPDFYPSELYAFQIFRLFPEGPQDWDGIHGVYQDAFDEIPNLKGNLNDVNQVPLLVTAGLPSVFGSTYEMDDLGAIKGKKWRASSPWHLKTLNFLGANTVSVPWEDIYTSLQTGVMDGVLTNFDGFAQMKFYEPAQEVKVSPQLWWATPFVHTINKDVWEGLPEDIQEGILKATEIATEKYGEYYADQLKETIDEVSEEANVSETTDEEVQPFLDDELLNGFREEWIKESESKHGNDDAEGNVETMKEIMDKYTN